MEALGTNRDGEQETHMDVDQELAVPWKHYFSLLFCFCYFPTNLILLRLCFPQTFLLQPGSRAFLASVASSTSGHWPTSTKTGSVNCPSTRSGRIGMSPKSKILITSKCIYSRLDYQIWYQLKGSSAMVVMLMSISKDSVAGFMLCSERATIVLHQLWFVGVLRHNGASCFQEGCCCSCWCSSWCPSTAFSVCRQSVHPYLPLCHWCLVLAPFSSQWHAGDVIVAHAGGPFVPGNATGVPCATPPCKTSRVLSFDGSLAAQPTLDYLATQKESQSPEVADPTPKETKALLDMRDAQSHHGHGLESFPGTPQGESPSESEKPKATIATPQGRAPTVPPSLASVKVPGVKKQQLKDESKSNNKYDKYYHQNLFWWFFQSCDHICWCDTVI